jgi:hypothetical protein
MPTHFAPQAPGVAGRPLSPPEIAGTLDRARMVDRFFRRIARDVALGVRLMLTSAAVVRPARFDHSQP